MEQLERELNHEITKEGFHISPRQPLTKRLQRFLQLFAHKTGRSIDEDDSAAAATLIMMRQKREAQQSMLPTQKQAQKHSMVLRSHH